MCWGWNGVERGSSSTTYGRRALIPWTDIKATYGIRVELMHHNLQEGHCLALLSSILCSRNGILTCWGCSQLFELFHAPKNLLLISLPLFCHTCWSRHMILTAIIFSVISLYANENPWISKYLYLSQLLCVMCGFDYCDHI
jgi:hypothetical protein